MLITFWQIREEQWNLLCCVLCVDRLVLLLMSPYIHTFLHMHLVEDTVREPVETMTDWLPVSRVVVTHQGNSAAFISAVQRVCVSACGAVLLFAQMRLNKRNRCSWAIECFSLIFPPSICPSHEGRSDDAECVFAAWFCLQSWLHHQLQRCYIAQ